MADDTNSTAQPARGRRCVLGLVVSALAVVLGGGSAAAVESRRSSQPTTVKRTRHRVNAQSHAAAAAQPRN